MLRIPYRLLWNLVALIAYSVAVVLQLLGKLRRRKITTLVEVALPAQMALRPAAGLSSLLTRPRGYLGWHRWLNDLSENPAVDGFVLHVRHLGWTWARAEHVGGLMRGLQAQGKQVVSYGHALWSQGYYAASHADLMALSPPGTVELTGLGVDLVFYADALSQLGVEGQFVHIGRYKTAAHRFIKAGATPHQRENLRTLLEDLQGHLSRRIEARTDADASATLSAGPQSAAEAKGRGLIDLVSYEDGLDNALASVSGGDTLGAEALPLRVVKASKLPARPKLHWKPLCFSPPRIAVVDMSGLIVMGDEQLPLAPTRRAVAYREYRKVLRQLARDRRVRAVVFAIDSPGGSAMASDLLWREGRRLADKKPLVASMQSVAGSGGYYLAACCPTIFAYKTTLTGSIGVVAGRFSLLDLLSKLHIEREHISVGPMGSYHSPYTKLSRRDLRHLRRSARAVYRRFVDRVAQGRGLSRSEVHARGEGRIYTGQQALEAGLVDRLGDLHAAIDAASDAAGVDRRRREVAIFPAPRRGFQTLLTRGNTPAASALTSAALGAVEGVFGGVFGDCGGALTSDWATIATLFARERALTLGPDLMLDRPAHGSDATLAE